MLNIFDRWKGILIAFWEMPIHFTLGKYHAPLRSDQPHNFCFYRINFVQLMQLRRAHFVMNAPSSDIEKPYLNKKSDLTYMTLIKASKNYFH